jgi:SAM-dependent methyltransferase
VSPPSPWRWFRARVGRLLLRAGFDLRLKTEDRAILERKIFPYFVNDGSFRKVLFVGCDWYTRGYSRIFAGSQYITLEVDPDRVFFGAKRHVVASVTDIARHFAPGELDVIFCNGVLGWGLNEVADAEVAFSGCYSTLRPGGVLVVSWDDMAGHRFPIGDVASLKRFERWTFPPLDSASFLVANEYRHTFEFLRRPASPA